TIPAFSLNQYGVYGDLVNVPAYAVAHHPASLSWEQAASIWMQYLTAYGALIEVAGLKAGEAGGIPAAAGSGGPASVHVAEPGGGDPHRPDARGLEAAGPARRWGRPRNRHGRAGPGPGGPRAHRGQGRPRRLRPGGRPDRGEAREGDDPSGHPLHLRGPEPG